jgi:hypothetical protein
LEGIIEAAGIIIFLIFVLPFVSRTQTLIILNGLPVIPIIALTIMEWKMRCAPNNNPTDLPHEEIPEQKQGYSS